MSLVFFGRDFYLFTLVMLCYVLFAGLWLLRFFLPAKKHEKILRQTTGFFARNFTEHKKSFGIDTFGID
ncbi:MAG: hypothetical protein AB1847_07230 [bacterium]